MEAFQTREFLILLGVRKGLPGVGVIYELWFMNRYSQMDKGRMIQAESTALPTKKGTK